MIKYITNLLPDQWIQKKKTKTPKKFYNKDRNKVHFNSSILLSALPFQLLCSFKKIDRNTVIRSCYFFFVDFPLIPLTNQRPLNWVFFSWRYNLFFFPSLPRSWLALCWNLENFTTNRRKNKKIILKNRACELSSN